jgi:glycosyltransferase involved in cell wall biosynthesis
MADKLSKLLLDEKERQRMGQAGQQRAYKMFSLDKMVDTYTTLYYEVSGLH